MYLVAVFRRSGVSDPTFVAKSGTNALDTIESPELVREVYLYSLDNLGQKARFTYSVKPKGWNLED